MIQKRFVAKITCLGELDLSFWQDHLDELLDYMEKHGYCSDYRKKVYYHARRIAVLSQDVCWNSYEDIWEWYSAQVHGERYLHDVRAILGILAEYHLHGIMPNNRVTQNPLCLRENNYSKLVTEYKQMVDA